ncbi:hypothetical protein EWI07_03530 [Sporolactobacillus sp. THM7-4]|nr:hypothetical protein EWI07_03530 [Sporolactobacillus sp. THM7-4]
MSFVLPVSIGKRRESGGAVFVFIPHKWVKIQRGLLRQVFFMRCRVPGYLNKSKRFTGFSLITLDFRPVGKNVFMDRDSCGRRCRNTHWKEAQAKGKDVSIDRTRD